MARIVTEPPLSPDLVEELERVAARFVRELTGADVVDGNWTLEAHFQDGRYTKAYAHRGPISRAEMKRIGERSADSGGIAP